jgi:hypothetical protein
MDRMLLHAQLLQFTHPTTGEEVKITASIDAEFYKGLALTGLADYWAL